jgi:hypothetical protein
LPRDVAQKSRSNRTRLDFSGIDAAQLSGVARRRAQSERAFNVAVVEKMTVEEVASPRSNHLAVNALKTDFK